MLSRQVAEESLYRGLCVLGGITVKDEARDRLATGRIMTTKAMLIISMVVVYSPTVFSQHHITLQLADTPPPSPAESVCANGSCSQGFGLDSFVQNGSAIGSQLANSAQIANLNPLGGGAGLAGGGIGGGLGGVGGLLGLGGLSQLTGGLSQLGNLWQGVLTGLVSGALSGGNIGGGALGGLVGGALGGQGGAVMGGLLGTCGLNGLTGGLANLGALFQNLLLGGLSSGVFGGNVAQGALGGLTGAALRGQSGAIVGGITNGGALATRGRNIVDGVRQIIPKGALKKNITDPNPSDITSVNAP